MAPRALAALQALFLVPLAAAALRAQRLRAAPQSHADDHCPGDRWGAWPSPVGLSLGVAAAAAGQVAVILYHYARFHWCANAKRIQQEPRPYDFFEGMFTHLRQPGGFVMLVAYLAGTWMFDLMPCSYYSFEGGIRFSAVAKQMISQDLLQYVMHWLEHKGFGAEFYKRSHKPHHVFTNPRLFDAFNGSLGDTFTMILIPLFATAQIVHVNVWEYMTFGASWSAWLCLIHSETAHPWDGLFRLLGLGTAADHHVHHKTFVHNYGHIFMWWDRLMVTYKAPESVRTFNKGI